MGSANERRRYCVTPPLIDRVHTQNNPMTCVLTRITNTAYIYHHNPHTYATKHIEHINLKNRLAHKCIFPSGGGSQHDRMGAAILDIRVSVEL